MKQFNRYLMVLILLPLMACADNSSEPKTESAVKAEQVMQVEMPANEATITTDDVNTAEDKQAKTVSTEAASVTRAAAEFIEGAYKEGVHYQRLPQPVATADRNKVEVVEVFWYGCIHCYQFEPQLESWAAQLPDYVDYKSMPAVWRNEMLLHAQAFYTAKALGVFNTMHPVLFDAMNKDGNRLEKESKIAKLFVANGVDEKEFEKTFNSFGVKSATSLAKSRLASYRITGTPEMVVTENFY